MMMREMKADLLRLTGALTDENSTINAVREAFPGTGEHSASRRTVLVVAYSGATFDNGSLILGAGSFILGDAYKQYVSQEEKYLKTDSASCFSQNRRNPSTERHCRRISSLSGSSSSATRSERKRRIP